MRAETLGCDLGKAASRQRLPARVQSLGLTVNVLVNNAGFATGGAFHQSDPDARARSGAAARRGARSR